MKRELLDDVTREEEMIVKDLGRPDCEELERALEREIVQRTWGRIRQLRVELTEGRLSVRGYTSSYYAKQLALAAIREVNPSDPVDLDIQVISGSQPCPVQGHRS
jgi:hypothetical protein